MTKITLGAGITGSFCTFQKTLDVLKSLRDQYNIIPILSYSARNMDTRFYKAADFKRDVEELTGNETLESIQQTEPIGPKQMLDILMILPCTGNTLAKLAHGVTDTPVTMAAKSHWRTNKPLLICPSTNDALGASFANLAALYNKKNTYIAPVKQDDVVKKPNSLVVDFDSVKAALQYALDGKQMHPLFL